MMQRELIQLKLQHLAEKLLHYMIKEYKDHDKVTFQIDLFKELHPEETAECLSKALYLLKKDGLVNIRPANEIALFTYLLPPAIMVANENPLFRKGYEAINN